MTPLIIIEIRILLYYYFKTHTANCVINKLSLKVQL